MHRSLEVLFTPADFSALQQRDISRSVCVVFDVLRATSSIVAALGNGAAGIQPVLDIPEALEALRRDDGVLLAGERDGLRIRGDLTGGPEFHLGNSPREFTRERVAGRRIVITTTNGTRALRACLPARRVLVASLLNLSATARALQAAEPAELLVVCSGTFEEAAYEDVLGAGALCNLVWEQIDRKSKEQGLSRLRPASLEGEAGRVADSALMARLLYRQAQADLPTALAQARNGRRLLSRPELSADVEFCAQMDKFDFVAELERDGWIVRR